ncbi:MAG: hypothetical protein AAGF95_30985 [Chloroflexota bacterium]
MAYERTILGKGADDAVGGSILTNAHVVAGVAGVVGGLGTGGLLGWPWVVTIGVAIIFALGAIVGATKYHGIPLYEHVWDWYTFEVAALSGRQMVAATSRQGHMVVVTDLLYSETGDVLFAPSTESLISATTEEPS